MLPTSTATMGPHEGAVRCATVGDVPAIVALFRSAFDGDVPPPAPAMIRELVRQGWFLVHTDEEGEMNGAVHVHVRGKVGHVSLLIVRANGHGAELAARMLSAADGLCAAYECTSDTQTH